jgi:hypothetical protein
LFILNRLIGRSRIPQYYSHNTASTKGYVFCSCPQVVLRGLDTEETPRVRGAEQQTHTRPCTPVTPDQTLHSKQNVQPTGYHNTTTLPDSSSHPSSREHGNTKNLVAAPCPSRQQFASPTKTANIRVRRSDYGTTLLQSPARAGYAHRMRQMFEEAGRNHESQLTGNELYPQLANVSRKASPPPIGSPIRSIVPRAIIRGSMEYCLESLCLPAAFPTAVPLKDEAQPAIYDLSERSSGSWSNDSGYLITQPRSRDCSFTVPPNERIYAWLLDVPDEAGDLANDNVETDAALEQSGGGVSLLRSTVDRDQDGLLTSQTHRPGLQSTLKDPFVCNTEARHPQAPSQRDRQRSRVFATDVGDHTQRNASSEVCKRLDHDHDADVRTPTMQQHSYVPRYREHTWSMQSHATESHILEEGSIQLSPLSPNVCVERGPSRYHSPRKPRDKNKIATPSRFDAPTQFQPPMLKENVVLGQQGAACIASPLAPRSNRLGTRFRRPQ